MSTFPSMKEQNTEIFNIISYPQNLQTHTISIPMILGTVHKPVCNSFMQGFDRLEKIRKGMSHNLN